MGISCAAFSSNTNTTQNEALSGLAANGECSFYFSDYHCQLEMHITPTYLGVLTGLHVMCNGKVVKMKKGNLYCLVKEKKQSWWADVALEK